MRSMKRSWFALVVLFLAGIGLSRADQIVLQVQQALKDQGFYYGDVTGTKTADTTAAIRRYQIRNGLQITGEIDAETLRSLGLGKGRSEANTAPQNGPTPSDNETQGADEDAPSQSAEIYPPAQTPHYQGQPGYPPAMPVPRVTPNVFADTPYEMAPADLQRHVVVGVQTLLTRWGYYHSGIDGDFGPGTFAAVRAFQARSGIMPTGRLDMATLAALRLLPGQRAPGYVTPPRRYFNRPVYRGEWIPDR
jgi:peptidoglycan hydrolase-like protein with peptidoglycan-binding domain